VFRVESGEWTVYFTRKLFSFLFCFVLRGVGEVLVKAKISQVPDNKESPMVAPHFSPLWFGKCFPPFTYIVGPKERNSIVQNKTSIVSLILNDGQIQFVSLPQKKKKKTNLGGTSSNEWER